LPLFYTGCLNQGKRRPFLLKCVILGTSSYFVADSAIKPSLAVDLWLAGLAGTRLVGADVQLVPVATVTACQRLCSAAAECRSVTFQTSTGVCSLKDTRCVESPQLCISVGDSTHYDRQGRSPLIFRVAKYVSTLK
jgi:hypothetical protein